MSKILFCFLAALTFMAAQGAEASMDSRIFSFTLTEDGKNPESVVAVVSSVWVDERADAKAIGGKLLDPLIDAIRDKLDAVANGRHWREVRVSEHSAMGFMGDIRFSVNIGFFKTGNVKRLGSFRDQAEITVLRHDGEKAAPQGSLSARVGDLLKMDDADRRQWIDEAAAQIVSLWRLDK